MSQKGRHQLSLTTLVPCVEKVRFSPPPQMSGGWLGLRQHVYTARGNNRYRVRTAGEAAAGRKVAAGAVDRTRYRPFLCTTRWLAVGGALKLPEAARQERKSLERFKSFEQRGAAPNPSWRVARWSVRRVFVRASQSTAAQRRSPPLTRLPSTLHLRRIGSSNASWLHATQAVNRSGRSPRQPRLAFLSRTRRPPRAARQLNRAMAMVYAP